MRVVLLVSATFLALAGSGPVLAQSATIRPGHVPGVGVSEPSSTIASNITTADARSTIAPRLPTPDVADESEPRTFLNAAKQAVASGRTGEAQEALERAEARLLDRAVTQDAVSVPDTSPAVQQIAAARQALAHQDLGGVMRNIDLALASLS